MTLAMARSKARKYSNQYNTHWFVKDCGKGEFEPWAHETEDSIKAWFYCGVEQ